MEVWWREGVVEGRCVGERCGGGEVSWHGGVCVLDGRVKVEGYIVG